MIHPPPSTARNAHNHIGTTIGDFTVVRPSAAGGGWYICVCRNGHTRPMHASKSKGTLRQGGRYRCKECRA